MNPISGIRPTFTIDLSYTIIPGKVTVGKYDGTHPCLTAVTNSDKVLIHSPHRRTAIATERIAWSQSNKEVALLNLSQTVTAILAAKVIPGDDKDVLIIGSPTHLLVYHVHDNRDVFYRECLHGVNALSCGTLEGRESTPTILVGGNCAVHAFDHTGTELFWTVLGDNVTDMMLFDYDNNGSNELVVGSEDFVIRVFKEQRTIAELQETESVQLVRPLPGGRFTYAVSNGTLGVYERETRLWRVKSKHNAVAATSYDLLGCGTEQLVTGWSGGKLDARNVDTGEVLLKEALGRAVAAVIRADYRGIGRDDLICVTVDGEVRGYASGSVQQRGVGSTSAESDTVAALFARKQALMLELRHYEANRRYNNETGGVTSPHTSTDIGVIPASTRLQIGVSTRTDCTKPHVEIAISTNNTTIIRAVMIFAEGIFEGETLVMHPKSTRLSNELSVPIHPPRDVPVDMHIKAFVGFPESKQYHVFELTRQLPRFSMYALVSEDQSLALKDIVSKQPESFVELQVHERLQRICIWINQIFLLPIDVEPDTGLNSDKSPDFILNMISLRDKTALRFVFSISGNMKIMTTNMQLAADLIQSLASFLNIENLKTKVSFKKEEDKLVVLLENLKKIQDAKERLGGDTADKLAQIRGLVIRAEDSRLHDITAMMGYYDELKSVNEELITGYNVRLSNNSQGLDAMKEINLIIQRAARLRVGKYASDVINNSKNAIKSNNVEGLIKIIRTVDA